MKKAFIRGLWGDFFEGEAITTPRPTKMIKDIVSRKDSELDFVVYTMGLKNHEYLLSQGFNSVLMGEQSVLWDMKTELYRHKLEVMYRAIQDYDAIVYLDWDCVLTGQLPDNFWDKMSEGATCQANLFQYRTKKCLWRNSDWRKTCNGGFVYIADKNIPYYFIENWNELREWAKTRQEERQARGLELRFREKCLMFDDEPAISKYIDDSCGGWPGMERYWDEFEPKVCNLRRKSAFTQEQNDSKDACFMHML